MRFLLQDLRYSLRVLGKSPGFAVVAALTLALAIGANAIVFSVMDSLIRHPLNVPQAQSLFMIESGRLRSGAQSYPDYLDLRDRNRSFESLAAYDIAQASLDIGENPSRSWGELVSGNYFEALGIRPHVGRFFELSDEHGANSAPFMVLSYGYWHTHFQDDRSIVGRTIKVNKNPFTIIGVAQPGFNGTLSFFSPDFYVPIVNQEQVEGVNNLNDRGSRWVFTVMGHLKPGVTVEQAITDLNRIGTDLEKSYPKDDNQMKFALASPGLYGDFLGPAVKAFVTGLMVLAGLILLAACANLGNLFAARAADRSREVALRLALGSSRKRVLRQLFIEAISISLIGGTLGLAGSIALLRGLSAWNPLPRFPVHMPVAPNASVYGITLLLALVSGVLFGSVPVRQVLRTNAYQVIKAGSTGGLGRRINGRDILLAVQISICAVLVTASMVAVRGLVRSLDSNFGFEPQNAMLADTDLAMAGYSGGRLLDMQKRMIEAVEVIPGVQYAGLSNRPPLSGGGAYDTAVFTEQATDLRTSNASANSVMSSASPEYFHAAGTTLLSGRVFTWHDDENAPRVAIVNQEFARKLFGSVSNAIGRYYKMPTGTRIQVVGVVTDGKYSTLTEDPQLAMFLPILQSPSSETWMIVRSNMTPQQLAAAMNHALRGLDKALPVYIQTWSKELDSALFAPRMATISLGMLGVMAGMLAVTGIFGMGAYSVSKRQRELGIRVAVGAPPRQILQAALGRALKLLAIGSAAGWLLGILASRVLASIVYQATPRDPLVFAGVVLVMSLLGLLATWIPARRALSVDPLILMREQ
jgi:predicted permease